MVLIISVPGMALVLHYLKSCMIHWMENYGRNGQPSLFYDNHDNPRMISKINLDPQYRKVLGISDTIIVSQPKRNKRLRDFLH